MAQTGVMDVACGWQRSETRTCPAYVCGAGRGDECSLPDLFTYDGVRDIILRNADGGVYRGVLVHETRYQSWMRR